MISLFLAALFGSNSRNLDQPSNNQQLFGYEQQQQQQSVHPLAHPQQQQQQQYQHGQSVIMNNNNLNHHQHQQGNHHHVNTQHQQQTSSSTNNTVKTHQQQQQLTTTTDVKPSAPSEGTLPNNCSDDIHQTTATTKLNSLNETINLNIENSTTTDSSNTPPLPTTSPQQQQQQPQTYTINIGGMPITIQKPAGVQQSQQPIEISMNATMMNGMFPSSNGSGGVGVGVDLSKPFAPISKTQVIAHNTAFGGNLCYQQSYNNGIRVNQRVLHLGDQWTSEHEHGTYNVCFRIPPHSGEVNAFSGIGLQMSGIANHKPPKGHTHFLVFNNSLQRLEKRAYPNDCRPSMPNARYMLLQQVLIPYNMIVSFEVDCVGGRVNKQSLSCVICMLNNGQSIRLNPDEMDSISTSSEKAQFMYQAWNYTLAMLKHQQQQQQQQQQQAQQENQQSQQPQQQTTVPPQL